MEAVNASCSGEFQSIRSAQAQQIASVEGLKGEILALNQRLLDNYGNINQQLEIFKHRISALESRPAGAPPASSGGAPISGDSGSASAGVRAAGAGQWTSDDWARWHSGT
eukprot:6945571-Alexandrium_andersonii.AAC.1